MHRRWRHDKKYLGVLFERRDDDALVLRQG
jgi:hypothetical protein